MISSRPFAIEGKDSSSEISNTLGEYPEFTEFAIGGKDSEISNPFEAITGFSIAIEGSSWVFSMDGSARAAEIPIFSSSGFSLVMIV